MNWWTFSPPQMMLARGDLKQVKGASLLIMTLMCWFSCRAQWRQTARLQKPTFAVRETSVSRHSGSPIKAPPLNSFNIIVPWWIEGIWVGGEGVSIWHSWCQETLVSIRLIAAVFSSLEFWQTESICDYHYRICTIKIYSSIIVVKNKMFVHRPSSLLIIFL